MKLWECPNCNELTDYILADIVGQCVIDTENIESIAEYERGNATCEHCGFEERHFSDEKFKLVECGDEINVVNIGEEG